MCAFTGASLLVGGCAGIPGEGVAARENGVVAAFVLAGADGQPQARVLTRRPACPSIAIDGRSTPMLVRAPAGDEALRAGPQSDVKPASFPVLTCEFALPANTRQARVGGRALALPAPTVSRIVVIGDTGCRLKLSDGKFQACRDSAAWPFAAIARQAAATKPDLVIHVGDYHYRESPCDASDAGCAGSPWGYGYDAWAADFFEPARPLLAAAPWVFVRGNHETCARAGQGWFRWFDHAPWTAQRSCNLAQFDQEADYSAPYGVPLGGGTQLLVFDSGKSSEKSYASDEPAYSRYLQQFTELDRLAARAPHNFFLSHHPVLGFAPGKSGPPKAAAMGLASVMRTLHGDALFAPEIDVALHGHVHLFEAISFATGQAATLIMGNGGSIRAHALGAELATTRSPWAHTQVAAAVSNDSFGFAMLERAGANWNITEFDQHGQAMLHCTLAGKVLTCLP